MFNYKYKNTSGEFAPYVLETENGRIINPTAEMYEAAGYYPYTPPQLTEEELLKIERDNAIKSLEDEIAKCDWKIIKTAEYRLVGLPDPYDTMALHQERQALRDQINEFEEQE